MTSMFDTAVRNRREHTPWATVSALRFMKEMVWNKPEGANVWEHQSELKCMYRPDVSSRYWWSITWTGEDGERHEASSQDLDLCMWRAAEMELRIRERLESERKAKREESA